MFRLIKFTITSAFLALLTACVSHTPNATTTITYTAKEANEDLDAFVTFVKTTHPDITYATSLNTIDTMADRVRQSLQDGMSAPEAWSALAMMNPTFKDAHVGLRRPLAEIAAFEVGGGNLFPAIVTIDKRGVIRFVGSDLQSIGIENGDELLSINDIKAEVIVETLASRMRGNSAVLGRLIMERYFAQYFWTVFGGYEEYVVSVKRGESSRTLSLPFGTTDSDEEETPFTFEVINKNVAYMDVTTFNISEKDRFQAFLKSAFAQISANGNSTLIIDLRGNGGGAHDVSDLLMAYLTDKPYSSISRLTARITPENIDRVPGTTLGDVVNLPFEQIIEPPKLLSNRFEGTTYVLIGGLTYSQAIVFSATVQDYKIATIVGEETEGPANQTGQVQSLKLPNTGFQVLAPIYIFTRASGDISNRGVIPEIEIKNDPLEPKGSINALLQVLENQPR